MRACDNPFRVQRLSQLAYRLDGTTWEALLARFATLNRRAALVGPEGRGKSTLLFELGARLERQGFRLRLATLRHGERRLASRDWERLFSGSSERDLLLVDGAQELAPREWRRARDASLRAGGLLVTSHRAGLLPTLHECRTTPELLGELMAELLDGAAPHDAVLASAEAARSRFQRHGGNLRDALLAAYDDCARAPSVLRG